MNKLRCPDCGVVLVGDHMPVCRFAPPPIHIEVVDYRHLRRAENLPLIDVHKKVHR